RARHEESAGSDIRRRGAKLADGEPLGDHGDGRIRFRFRGRLDAQGPGDRAGRGGGGGARSAGYPAGRRLVWRSAADGRRAPGYERPDPAFAEGERLTGGVPSQAGGSFLIQLAPKPWRDPLTIRHAEPVSASIDAPYRTDQKEKRRSPSTPLARQASAIPMRRPVPASPPHPPRLFRGRPFVLRTTSASRSLRRAPAAGWRALSA